MTPDPAARKADELDWRDPGADQSGRGIPRPCSRRRDSRTASPPPPRPRRGSRIPARRAPWIASERVVSPLLTLAGDRERADPEGRLLDPQAIELPGYR